MCWLQRSVSSACGAATQASHAALRLGPLSTRQQRNLTTHASATYTFSGRNPLALWSGRGGEMQVERRPMLSTGRDGAQRVTRHFPTWRGGCDKDISGIRIVQSLRRIAQFASRQCRQKAVGSPRGLLCKRRRGSLLCCDHLCVWLCGRLPRYSLFRHRRTELRVRQGIVGGCQVCAEYHGRALGVWPHAVHQCMSTSTDTARSSSCV